MSVCICVYTYMYVDICICAYMYAYVYEDCLSAAWWHSLKRGRRICTFICICLHLYTYIVLHMYNSGCAVILCCVACRRQGAILFELHQAQPHQPLVSPTDFVHNHVVVPVRQAHLGRYCPSARQVCSSWCRSSSSTILSESSLLVHASTSTGCAASIASTTGSCWGKVRCDLPPM